MPVPSETANAHALREAIWPEEEGEESEEEDE